jgi:hypothetical protein
MKDENRIYTYFDRVKQNPPLMDIEKVRQIIGKAEVKVKTKKGRRNFLKFTIMTTIFAVIISAALIWPGEKFQNTNDQIIKNISLESVETNKTIENITNREVSGDKEDNSKKEEKYQQKIGTDTISRLTPEKTGNLETFSFDSNSFKTIEGNLKMVIADPSLLERLGFQIRGDSLIYKNKTTQNIEIRYNFNFDIYTHDPYEFTHNDFYLIAESHPSDRFFSFNWSILPYNDNSFQMANDTLLPICITPGLVRQNSVEFYLWFTVTDDLIQRLPTNNEDIKEQFRQRKQIKKFFPNINLVNYSPPLLFDPTSVIDLSREELMNLGFSVSETNGLFFNKWEVGNRMHKEVDLYFPFITDLKGDWIVNLAKNKGLGFDELCFDNVIPIVIRKDSFPELSLFGDHVNWFKITEDLFYLLPERISTDLRKEYNYITAEDKTNLEKPECKYFEECKNTLKVSNFKVYPNPANNQATVSFTLPEAINGRITLIDLSGRERQVLQPNTNYSKGSHQVEVDLSNVSEGIYLITLYSNKGIQTQRLIVLR